MPTRQTEQRGYYDAGVLKGLFGPESSQDKEK